MGRKRNEKKRIIIGIIICIILTIITTLGIGTIKVVNANKITSSLELGKKYLEEQEYDKAQEELLKITLIDSDNEEALALIELTKYYIELENLY